MTFTGMFTKTVAGVLATLTVMGYTDMAGGYKTATHEYRPPQRAVSYAVDPDEVEYIAKMLYGECRGEKDKAQQAACVWCVLNRVDSDDPYYPDDVIGVITQKYQFAGYRRSNPVWPELAELAEDVLVRWYREKDGETDVGRTLPKEYLFFASTGLGNRFRTEFEGGKRWDWSLPSPYED